MNNLLYVVAPSARHYDHWRRSLGLPHSQVRFVKDWRVLKDLKGVNILFLKGWQRRPDWREVYNAALKVGLPDGEEEWCSLSGPFS